MTTKPLPEHGTYARANGSPGYREPCNCDECLRVKRAARKRQRINRELGRSNLIDAQPAREHLTLLHHTMCWRTLAKRIECDPRNLMLIYNGKRSKVTRATHLKIMAVRPPAKADLTLYTDATGTRRRIQALQAIGHSYQAIATAAQTTRCRVNLIADGHQPTVRQTIAQRVADAYRHLASRPAPIDAFSNRSRNNAASKGWHGPLAWDNIDDPAAEPDTDGIGYKAPNPKRDPLRGDEIKHLAPFGFSADSIAKQVGLPVKDVKTRLGKLAAEKAANRVPDEQPAAA